MGRPRGPGTRVLSYEDRGGSGSKRFRVRYLLDGQPVSVGFATAREAAKVVARIEKLAASRPDSTVEETIERWLADRLKQGLAVYPYYSRWTFDCLARVLGEPMHTVRVSDFVEGYKAKADQLAGATASLALTCLKVFGAYLVEQSLFPTNPAEGIKPRGVKKKGKPQIGSERELLAFQEEAFRRAHEGDRVSLGLLLCLHLGLRPGEARKIEARHVDLGRVVRVPGTKTENAPRSLRVVSDELWGLVDDAAKKGGRLVPHAESVMVTRTRQIARAAKVSNAEELVAHSLRGNAATLAVDGGAMEAAIAAGLGHASFEITGKHYASKDSQESAATRSRMRVLRGGKA